MLETSPVMRRRESCRENNGGNSSVGKGWPRNASLISEGGEGVSHEDNAGAVSRQRGKLAEKYVAC